MGLFDHSSSAAVCGCARSRALAPALLVSAALAFAVCCGVPGAADAAVTLTPGTLLGINFSGRITQYSRTGQTLGTLDLPSSATFAYTGLAVIGPDVYVSEIDGEIYRVNLVTGQLTNTLSFGGNNEGLGNIGGDLLDVDFVADQIRRVSTANVLLGTIQLPQFTQPTGIDSNGSVLYLASYATDSVLTLDLAGTQLSSFGTGFGGGRISALGYDATDGTLWVSTGFGDDRIRQYTTAGTLLSDFPALDVNGLDVVVPEPTALAAAAAGLAVFCGRRRCPRAPVSTTKGSKRCADR